MSDPSSSRLTTPPAWWETRWFLVLLVLLAAVPLLRPAIPPLTDVPAHMGRWYISTALAGSPDLQRYYGFHWSLVGNLGMDLIVPCVAALIGIEPASKLCVMLVPMLTVAGLLWTAREAHGRVPPASLFALPFAYAWPFQMGFVNFELAQGLALLAFALWIRWGRLGRLRLRAALFVPIACLLWIAHNFGWGLFGLFAFGAELGRLRAARRPWLPSVTAAVLHCLPLALPVLLMIAHPNHTARGLSTGNCFDWNAKAVWAVLVLKDRWGALDILSLMPVLMMIYVGVRGRKDGMEPILLFPALLCLAAFVLLPGLLLGGAYVDMRMPPIVFMTMLIAIRPAPDPKTARTIALLGLAFFLARTAMTTASYWLRDAEQQAELGALPSIRPGSAVLVLVKRSCRYTDTDPRLEHIAGIGIIRRQIFDNEQWALEGQQLLSIHYPQAAPFTADPSQQVFPKECPQIGTQFDPAIRSFNRAAFDYVWTLGFPPRPLAGLPAVWTNGRSTLYRVAR